MECAHCGRLFPEVVGAPSQVCPHCGHEMDAAPSPAPEAATRPPHVDPVGAMELAAKIGRKRYGRLLLIWLPALLVEIGVGIAIDAYTNAAGIPADVASLSTGQQMQLLGVALPLTILLYSVRLATWTFTAACTLDAALGGSRLSGWRALLGPALLAGLVLTLVYSAGILLIVGTLVFLHWFLYAPAQLAAGAPTIGAAFDRSRRFARDHRTYGFTALIVLLGLVILVPYFVTDAYGGWVGIVVPALIAWIGGPIVPLLAASYVALSLQQTSAEGAPTEEKLPTTRSTAKCPQCGTLIPYTANPAGGPVEIVCPSCGQAGRVL